MRIATFFLFLGLFLQVQAQMKQPDPTVFIFVGDSIFPMNVITSQTELKKGWDIRHQCRAKNKKILLGGTGKANHRSPT